MHTGVSLSQSQLTAAKHLYDRLPLWQATKRALFALAEHFPSFDIESALLKVAAINQLYGTNLYAVVRMAKHVSDVVTAPDDRSAKSQVNTEVAQLIEAPTADVASDLAALLPAELEQALSANLTSVDR